MGLKTDISKVRSEHIDYPKAYLESNRKAELVDPDWQVVMKPGMRDAYIHVINTAFPAGVIRSKKPHGYSRTPV